MAAYGNGETCSQIIESTYEIARSSCIQMLIHIICSCYHFFTRWFNMISWGFIVMQPLKPKVPATLCCCALGGCDCMHECISNYDDMIMWDAWMHEGFIRLHVHMLSQGSEVASLPSHPAMALVAVEQSDGSMHVQAPLKFKLGVPRLFGTHTMTPSSFSLTMLDIY